MVYNCSACNYSTINKYDYTKHNKTQKHKKYPKKSISYHKMSFIVKKIPYFSKQNTYIKLK